MSRRHLFRLFAVLLLGLAIFGLSHHRGSANVDVEDSKLKAFIEAAATVDGVVALWQPKIARAGDQAVDALRQQANLQIRESIEQVDGISYGEYRDLRQAIVADPDIRRRVTELMQRSLQP